MLEKGQLKLAFEGGAFTIGYYDRRFPVEDLPRLLLATRLGGAPLSADHGHPARLVVADRRGFWWVKWVVDIELSPLPHWWQLPFPLQ